MSSKGQDVVLDNKIGTSSELNGDDVISGSSSELYPDPILQKRILRKLDTYLAPLFCALYFLSYLDLSNIGNAAIAGLKDQLKLRRGQYSTAVSVFFVTDVACMFPLVMGMRELKTHRCITIMACAWSLVTIGTAFARSYGSLLACRLILGICESGFFPCISLYIAMVSTGRNRDSGLLTPLLQHHSLGCLGVLSPQELLELGQSEDYKPGAGCTSLKVFSRFL